MTSYEEEAAKFLATKDNLKQALDIGRLVPMVKQRLERDYWKGLRAEVKGRIGNESISGWDAVLYSNHGDVEPYSKDEGIHQQCDGLWIRPSGASQLFCGPAIEQENRRLFFGICFSKEKQPNIDEVNDLRAALQKVGFKADDKWWLCWKWTDTQMDIDQFYLDMADAPDNFIRKHADLILGLFKNYKQAIERINVKVAETVA